MKNTSTPNGSIGVQYSQINGTADKKKAKTNASTSGFSFRSLLCCSKKYSATALALFLTFSAFLLLVHIMPRAERKIQYPYMLPRRSNTSKLKITTNKQKTTTKLKTTTTTKLTSTTIRITTTRRTTTTVSATSTKKPPPPPTATKQELKWFEKQMSKKETEIYVNLMKKFTDACDHFNFTCMIVWGTLLGSYRHHGFIPWDDDVDIYMDYNHKQDVHKMIKYMGKDYKVWTNQGVRWKVTNVRHSWKTRQAWGWPFLDLSFFKQSKTHIYDSATNWGTYKKTDVFPLILRPFENQWFKAPRTLQPVLGGAATLKECCTRNWNHRKEYGLRVRCIACNKLYSNFPFVFRRDLGNGSIAEDLKYHGKFIRTIVTKKPEK